MESNLPVWLLFLLFLLSLRLWVVQSMLESKLHPMVLEQNLNRQTLVSEVVDVFKRSPKKQVLLKVERSELDVEINVIPDVNSDDPGRIGVITLNPLPTLDGGTLALILISSQRIMSSGIMFDVILGIFLLILDTLNLDFIRDLF
ncbi:hypothetical protein M9H77_32223 [Catharanthus roseus]|uniref:Uncharacterized protein n=1 Tax=Catharanthus roseus TaxID=4058 RepID=A0ACC0A673_CATRO|nr:hypothetical protein M9H77_32223 [Catharanthus roseus]